MAEVFDFGLQEHKIKMDGGFSNNGLFAVVGDTARRLEVQLLDTNGNIQNATGINLRLNADVSGKLTFVDALIKDATKGVYVVDLANGMFLEPGNWFFQWQITKGNSKISSFPFTVRIGANVSEGGEQATNFYLNAEELHLKTIELQTSFDNLGVQFQNLIDETTGKDIVSAPEIIVARKNKPNLNARLEDFEQSTTAQFQHTADRFKIKKVESAWTLSLDDSQVEDSTVMLPMLERKGVKATFGVISDNVGKVGFTNESQLLEIQNKGHEIASHGKAHESRYPDITDGALDIELRVSKESLIARGFNVKNMLTPFGNTDERVMNAQSKYYRSARVSGIGALGELNKTPINTFRITSILIGDTSGIGNGVDPVSGKEFDTLGYWKYWLDKAIETKSWIVFIGHSYMINLNNRMGDLEQLIDYAKSKGDAIKNLTYDKALDIFENKVETSGMKIGADGRITGNFGKAKSGKGNSVTGLTSLDDIEPEMITFNTVYDGGDTGMPRNVGGTMLTVKSDNLGVRSFQLAKSSHVDDYDQLYLRTFNAAKEPSDFFKLNNLSIIKNIPFAHTPGTLKDRVVTYSYIDNASATSYPEATGGLLIAHFVADDWGSCHETYKIRNTDRKYTRSWDATKTAWTVFKEVVTDTKMVYDSVTFNTPISEFANGSSYCQITAGKTPFPEGTAGLLETKKYAGNGYCYQIYHLYNVATTYKRVWRADSNWSAFVKTGV